MHFHFQRPRDSSERGVETFADLYILTTIPMFTFFLTICLHLDFQFYVKKHIIWPCKQWHIEFCCIWQVGANQGSANQGTVELLSNGHRVPKELVTVKAGGRSK